LLKIQAEKFDRQLLLWRETMSVELRETLCL